MDFGTIDKLRVFTDEPNSWAIVTVSVVAVMFVISVDGTVVILWSIFVVIAEMVVVISVVGSVVIAAVAGNVLKFVVVSALIWTDGGLNVVILFVTVFTSYCFAVVFNVLFSTIVASVTDSTVFGRIDEIFIGVEIGSIGV